MIMVFGRRLAELNEDEIPPYVSDAFIRATRQTIEAIQEMNNAKFYVTVIDHVGEKTRIGTVFRSRASEIYTFADFRDQIPPDAPEAIIDLLDVVSVQIDDPLYPAPRIQFPKN